MVAISLDAENCGKVPSAVAKDFFLEDESENTRFPGPKRRWP